MTSLHAFGSARRHYRSRLREDPAAPPETYRQPMLDASAASDAALDALRSQIGFILADDVRALADAAEKALTMAAAGVLLDQSIDSGTLGARANAAYEALAARLRDIYATRESAVPTALSAAIGRPGTLPRTDLMTAAFCCAVTASPTTFATCSSSIRDAATGPEPNTASTPARGMAISRS